MAKVSNTNNNKSKKNDPKKPEQKGKTNDIPVFRNPGETLWGKIIIYTLAAGFVIAIVVGLILLFVKQ